MLIKNGILNLLSLINIAVLITNRDVKAGIITHSFVIDLSSDISSNTVGNYLRKFLAELGDVNIG
jgi:hypothetical protein